MIWPNFNFLTRIDSRGHLPPCTVKNKLKNREMADASSPIKEVLPPQDVSPEEVTPGEEEKKEMTPEEEEAKKEVRKEAPERNPHLNQPVNPDPLLHTQRTDAIHVHYVNNLSTDHIKALFCDFNVRDLEWINDASCTPLVLL